jgi:hypothetical protein
MAGTDVVMTRKDAIDEHSKLVRVLRSGSKKDLASEARDQARELKKYRRGSSRSGRK